MAYQERRVLAETPIVEDQQELTTRGVVIGRLDGMGLAGREIPQRAFLHAPNVVLTLGGYGCNLRGTLQDIGPLRGVVPVKLPGVPNSV